MGKMKPRHNPDKPQNNKPLWCPYCEVLQSGTLTCIRKSHEATKICQGNPHNCIKTKYHEAAIVKGRKNVD